MKKLRIITAVVIILSAATMLCVVRTMGAQDNDKTVVVTITPHPGQAPSVDKPIVDLWSDMQVEWTCDGGCDFTVEFPASHAKPFSDSTFNNAHSNSGHPTGPAGRYPYRVTVGGQTLDPIIIIH